MKKLFLRSVLPLLLIAGFNGFARIEDEDIQNMDQGLVIERIGKSDIEAIVPDWVFSFSEAELVLRFKNPEHTKLLISNHTLDFIINGQNQKLTFTKGEARIKFKPSKDEPVSVYCEEFSYSKQISVVPSWVIIAPIALILLWIVKRVIRRKKA